MALGEPINQRYLAAKRSRPEGDVYVSVYVATNRATHHKETQDHPVILLDVIDAVPLETGMVTIDAAAMAKVVGHTDNVGTHEYKMGLSERRAASVVRELTAKHGVAAARLNPRVSACSRRSRPTTAKKGGQRTAESSW